MFEIGFSELVLVMIVGLIVLGPERLPVAVKTVVGWVRALRTLASTVQNELTQELKLQELQDSLKKVEQASLENLSPELKSSMDELRSAAEAMKKSYTLHDVTSPVAETQLGSVLENTTAVDPSVIEGSVVVKDLATDTDLAKPSPTVGNNESTESIKSGSAE